MTTDEKTVVNFMQTEEKLLRIIEATLDLADESLISFTKEQVGWYKYSFLKGEESNRKEFMNKFIEKAPIYRERLEHISDRWKAIGERFI